jgi:hypothetical protein
MKKLLLTPIFVFCITAVSLFANAQRETLTCANQAPSVDCMRWVTEGTEWMKKKAEAAIVCRGGVLVECLEWVYKGNQKFSRAQAATLCRGNVTLSCLQWVFEDPKVKTREQAAKICSGNINGIKSEVSEEE